MRVLDRIDDPRELKGLTVQELTQLANECRGAIIETITKRGGHLASKLGIGELTLALPRAFDSPRDEAYPELAVRTAATAGDNGTMAHQTETVTW